MRKRSPMLDPKSPKGGAICVSPFEGIVFPSPVGEESIQLFHKFSLLTYKGQLPARVKRIAQRILHFQKLQAEPNFKGGIDENGRYLSQRQFVPVASRAQGRNARAIENESHGIAHIEHQIMYGAGVFIGTVGAFAVGGTARAGNRRERSVEDSDDLPSSDPVGRARQPVAAPLAFLAAQNAGIPEFE